MKKTVEVGSIVCVFLALASLALAEEVSPTPTPSEVPTPKFQYGKKSTYLQTVSGPVLWIRLGEGVSDAAIQSMASSCFDIEGSKANCQHPIVVAPEIFEDLKTCKGSSPTKTLSLVCVEADCMTLPRPSFSIREEADVTKIVGEVQPWIQGGKSCRGNLKIKKVRITQTVERPAPAPTPSPTAAPTPEENEY